MVLLKSNAVYSVLDVDHPLKIYPLLSGAVIEEIVVLYEAVVV